MSFRNWLDKLKDASADPYERRFRLFSLFGVLIILLWGVIISVVEYDSFRLSFLIVVLLIYIPVMIRTLQTGNVRRGAALCAGLLTFILFPFLFFHEGGLIGGSPDYAVLIFIFILMTMSGRRRTVMAVAVFAELVLCVMIFLLFPETVREPGSRAMIAEILISVFSTFLYTGVAILFQLYMFRQERAILEQQRNEIGDLNRAQNRFFSSMSHEIRTPINTIIGMNELILRDRTLSDESAGRSHAIHAASGMLLTLINDILDMSKIESGKLDIIPVEYDTGELFVAVAGMISERAREKGLRFIVNVDETLPKKLYGDEVRIRQVLINLLNNAVKYTQEGSVTMSVQGDFTDENNIRLAVRVEDTGMGIKKDAIPYLFDAFRRVDEKMNRNIEGTGLGLSIVKQIMELMGGEVTVSSIYTKGSIFTVSMPQSVMDRTPVGSLSFMENVSRETREYYKQSFEAPDARLLIVDDNEMNLAVETGLLKETRIVIDTAVSGEKALFLTARTQYDVIFMDHLMPEMDGIECRRKISIQEGGLNRETPVIVLTANAGAENQALYAANGFDGYLLKPVTAKQLEETLMKALPPSKVSLTGATTMQSDTETVFTQLGRRKHVHITVDSGTDLPKELIAQYDIGVLNLFVETDRGRFLDHEEIDHEEILQYLEDKNHHVKSVVPDVEYYERFFGEQVTAAQHVIHIALPRSVSDGMDHAVTAAKAFDNITVLDAGAVSGGAGLVALYAAHLADRNLSAEEVLVRLRRMIPQVRTSFVMENANYMVRNGLAKQLKSALMDAFLMHPLFVMRNGRLVVHVAGFDTYRERYVRQIVRRFKNVDTSLLLIPYVGLTAEELARIGQQVKEILPFRRIIPVKASGAIAANCGPGTFGLMFRTLGEELETKGSLFDFLPEQVTEQEQEKPTAPVVKQDVREDAKEEIQEDTVTETAEDTEAPVSEASAIDMDEAMRNCGSRELLENAVKLFASSITEKADAIEQCLNEEDWENFTIKVHALKSSARLIGATKISKAAEELERLGNIAREND